MIHINKDTPLEEFNDFIRFEHPQTWADIHNSKRFPDLYRHCFEHISFKEQNSLGGYTERLLTGVKRTHIDHYKKKGLNWSKDVTFDWDNLIAEEYNANYGACFKDKYTSDIRDYENLLNPVVDYPEKLMDYLPNGDLKPKTGLSANDKKKVEFTIERFNLNHKTLCEERKGIIRMILNDYKQLSDEDIKEALNGCGYPTVVDWCIEIRNKIANA